MWKRILEALLALLKPKPAPAPVPPPPVPVPVPTPPPVPVPPPVPPPPVPTPNPACGKPTSLKLGIRGVRQLLRGWRIAFDCSPLVDGVKVSEGCGPYYLQTYGEVEAFQKGPGFDHDPVERGSDGDGFILVIATNNEADWQDGRYKRAGKYTIGVSYPWLNSWRCQDFTIDEKGEAHGYGNNQQSYDLFKYL
jgi:hypothetical protein